MTKTPTQERISPTSKWSTRSTTEKPESWTSSLANSCLFQSVAQVSDGTPARDPWDKEISVSSVQESTSTSRCWNTSLACSSSSSCSPFQLSLSSRMVELTARKRPSSRKLSAPQLSEVLTPSRTMSAPLAICKGSLPRNQSRRLSLSASLAIMAKGSVFRDCRHWDWHIRLRHAQDLEWIWRCRLLIDALMVIWASLIQKLKMHLTPHALEKESARLILII